MSTQPFSSLETTTPLTTKDTLRLRSGQATEHGGEFKSLLDEPWRVTILPEAPKLPPGVLPSPEAHATKSLPWRKGDVARLKDDSPEGMMRYIAAHTSGWWQEMAERALRDTEKAERMAREAGWQPGQYWALEVDAEERQKLLEAEEARRQREEVERAKEAAEKEAFMQRQMELLKKAGRAPRCEYVYTDGRGCGAPQVKGERWCHGHARTMSYRPEKLELEPMEDEQAVMVNLYRVTKSLLAGRISEKTAGLMLWSVAIGMPGARRLRKPGQPQRTRRAHKGKTHHGGPHPSKPESGLPGASGAETRRKSSPLINTNDTDKPESHSGVTNDKSFKSGVDGGSTPGTRKNDSRSGENALTRHKRTQHPRDLSTPPHVADASSESLKMTAGGGRRGCSEHRESSMGSDSSVSPRLRGEGKIRTTKDTKDHKEVTAGEQVLGAEPSHSIRVDPRQSAVSSCSSSASPRFRGEIGSSRREVLPPRDGRFSLERPREIGASGILGHRDIRSWKNQESHSSVSPCLRGENDVQTTKATKDREAAEVQR